MSSMTENEQAEQVARVLAGEKQCPSCHCWRLADSFLGRLRIRHRDGTHSPFKYKVCRPCRINLAAPWDDYD